MNTRALLVTLVVFAFAVSATAEAKVPYLPLQPMTVGAPKTAAKLSELAPGALMLPTITWGGDIATKYASDHGLFKAEGLDVKLVHEDSFSKQLEAFLKGSSPFLRGTLDQIMAASEACERAGIRLDIVYQHSWSDAVGNTPYGGDVMVVRPSVKSAKDFAGKKVVLQLPGPHMYYAAKVVTSGGAQLSDVTFLWMPGLFVPTTNTGGQITDSVTAFMKDPTADAVMCLLPDALNLTKGGTVGDGADGMSVKGARILLTTKTANRVIADVYAVRSDYLQANRETVRKVVHVLLNAAEQFEQLAGNRTEENAKQKWDALMQNCATYFFGDGSLTKDVAALVDGCTFAGYTGNVRFFTGEFGGKTETQWFDPMKEEIQRMFIQMGLLSKRVPITSAGWDYPNELAKGLANTKSDAASVSKFDPEKVSTSQRGIERPEGLKNSPVSRTTESTYSVIAYLLSAVSRTKSLRLSRRLFVCVG